MARRSPLARRPACSLSRRHVGARRRQQLRDECCERLGRIDIVVNDVGRRSSPRSRTFLTNDGLLNIELKLLGYVARFGPRSALCADGGAHRRWRGNAAATAHVPPAPADLRTPPFSISLWPWGIGLRAMVVPCVDVRVRARTDGTVRQTDRGNARARRQREMRPRALHGRIASEVHCPRQKRWRM